MALDDYGNDPLYNDPDEARRRAEQSANSYNSTTTAPVVQQSSFMPAPNSTQAWTRQNVSETLARYGAATQENLNRAVQENPWLGQTDGRGRIIDVTGSGTGSAGRAWDVIGNLADTTGATTHWQTLTGNTARAKAAAAAASPAIVSRAPGAVAPVAPVSSGQSASGNVAQQQSIAPVQDPRMAALYEELLKRSQQGLAIDRNDPAIRGQADAYAANETRAQRNYLADLAESSGPNANLRGEQRLASERVGQRTGSYEAELVGRELTARRGEIAEALNSRQGMLTFEQQQRLTKELALMDDAIKRLQLKQQGDQFTRGLDQQKTEFAETMKFRYADLNQQQKQFMEDLGYRWNGRQWDQNPANPQNRL